MINGYVGSNSLLMNTTNHNEQKSNFILISRKDTRRSGMRQISRGSDQDGNVANFVETEQILVYKSTETNRINIISYIQIRGSIPIDWSQETNLSYTPKVIFKT